MPIIKESDLKKQIKSEQFHNLYFLYGDEKLLVRNYTDKIINTVLKEKDNTFNFQIFSGGEIDVDSFYDFASAVPFMSRYKCVKVVDLDLSKFSESSLKKFKSALESLPDTTVVVISQTGVNVSAKESAKWTSFLKFINKHACTCEFKQLTNLQASKILVSWASKYNVSLNENVALAIIDFCGCDLLNLKNEMSKLFAFVGEEGVISKEIIDKLLIKDIYANVFSISKHLLNRNLDSALKELNVLLHKKEEPTMILSILSSAYLDMYRAYVVTESLKDPSVLTSLFDDYKGKAFRIDIAVKNCKKFSLDTLKECLNLLTETDLKLKTYRVDRKVTMETTLVKLASMS